MNHEPKPIKIYPKEFFPSIIIENEGEENNKLLNAVLTDKDKLVSDSDFFRVIVKRRSTRNFSHLCNKYNSGKDCNCKCK